MNQAELFTDAPQHQMNAVVTHPIIFLDIDDVLCRCLRYGGHQAIVAMRHNQVPADDFFEQLFHPEPKAALAAIHAAMDGQVHYVISSTWRLAFKRAELKRLFVASGLDFVAEAMLDEAHWRTRSFEGLLQRSDEIASWLAAHGGDRPFVILDDTFSGKSLQAVAAIKGHLFAGRVVICEECVGLTADHVPAAVGALRRPI